jgi:hypothetical protein
MLFLPLTLALSPKGRWDMTVNNINKSDKVW